MIIPCLVDGSSTTCTKSDTVDGVPTGINVPDAEIVRKLSFEVRQKYIVPVVKNSSLWSVLSASVLSS